jgi:hypothetical protein
MVADAILHAAKKLACFDGNVRKAERDSVDIVKHDPFHAAFGSACRCAMAFHLGARRLLGRERCRFSAQAGEPAQHALSFRLPISGTKGSPRL